MAKDLRLQQELRVAILYHTTTVPGQPKDRAHRIADDFATSKLRRNFSHDHDFIHCPPDFDSDASKSTWILCDFNIRDRLTQVENIPVEYWKVKYSSAQIA